MYKSNSVLRALRVDALDIYRYALESVKVDRLMREAVRVKGDILLFGCRQPTTTNQPEESQFDLKLYNPHVIGGGKSVMAMACELAKVASQSRINHLFSHGLLSLPGGLETCMGEKSMLDVLDSIQVKCYFGSLTNLPSENSVEASKMMLEEVKKACRFDRMNGRIPLFIVLLSGGGSSCLTSPRYITLQEKLQLISFLVQNGADIVELNKVRRFFSNIKGGKLAKHILACEPQAKVITLTLSDVIGDQLEFIASGPTHIEEGTCHYSSMLQVLEKYGYDINLDYTESKSIYNIDLGNQLINYIIGNNKIAIDAAIKRAQELGYQVKNLGNRLSGSTESILNNILSSQDSTLEIPNDKLNWKTLVIGGGEATIDKLDTDSWGKGGRAQEMGLDFLVKTLEGENLHGAVRLFLAGSTDGQDGPTDIAACLSYVTKNQNINEQPYSLQEVLTAKRSHDSYNFWTRYQPDSLIKTGLTGTNVMDLYMLLSDYSNEAD